MKPFLPHPASYRDPSGFVFYDNGTLYRQVNQVYKDAYSTLHRSGLFDRLVQAGKLIPSEQVAENLTHSADWFCTLRPEPLAYVSYPYEWSFGMLKEAALLTLDLATEAMTSGMMLKDATPYNVQWHKGKMIFIDTLSFEPYREDEPWIAYKQFCESFLLPLALMHYTQQPLQPLLLAYPEGIPLPVGKTLLPWRSRFHINTYLHLHLNAAVTAKKPPQERQKQGGFSAKKLTHILQSLKQAVQSYTLSRPGIWSDYYSEATQRQDYVEQKKMLVEAFLNELPPLQAAIDVGANEGFFSVLLAGRNITTLAVDFDHFAVNRLYEITKQTRLPIHPLVMDMAQPSPAIGVNNRERASFLERTQTDLVLALAVVHHLAIGKNIPWTAIVQLFRQLGRALIVEFIPKQDEKVQLMLQQKKDVYTNYSEASFCQAFSACYRIVKERAIGHSGRKLFLMVPHET